MLNLAVGGGYFTSPYAGPASDTVFERPALVVDYVRVFELPPPEAKACVALRY